MNSCDCAAHALLTDPALTFLVSKSVPSPVVKFPCKTSVQTPIVGGFLCHLDSENVQMCSGLGDAEQTSAGGALKASLFALLFAFAHARRCIFPAIVNSSQSMLKKDLSSCLPPNISLWRPGTFYSFSETRKDEWKNVTSTYVKSKATGVASAFCWDSKSYSCSWSTWGPLCL